MALSKLSDDEQRIIFVQLCNPFDPGVALSFSSASNELRELTQAERQRLRAVIEAAAALGRKLGMRSCKELREAKAVSCSAAAFTLLATLGSVLPALETLDLYEQAAGPDGVQRLAEKLGAGALPAVTRLQLFCTHVGDAGASALAAALGRGAMPRLKRLVLFSTASLGDAGLVALAPAIRRLPALEHLDLRSNSVGDEGLAALVAPPPPAGALRPPTGVLTRLKKLDVGGNFEITDAGCATLTAAIDSGILPVLEEINLKHTHASDASRAAVQDALMWRLTNFRTAEVAHEVAHALLSLGS